jgi:hypothetical protein
MGINPKVYFLGGMGGRSLVVSQSRNVGFLKKIQGLFFWWCGMEWLEKWGWYKKKIVIFSFVIW